MNTLEEWTAAVCADLGIDPATADTKAVLDLARDVAHAVARPAAPLTAYLVGVAVGQGLDRAAAMRRVLALTERWDGHTERWDGHEEGSARLQILHYRTLTGAVSSGEPRPPSRTHDSAGLSHPVSEPGGSGGTAPPGKGRVHDDGTPG